MMELGPIAQKESRSSRHSHSTPGVFCPMGARGGLALQRPSPGKSTEGSEMTGPPFSSSLGTSPRGSPRHHTPSTHPPLQPIHPFLLALSIATEDDSLGKQKTTFLSLKSHLQQDTPCLYPGIVQALKASHHITQADLSAPRAETWCHFTPRKTPPMSFPSSNMATPMGPFQGNKIRDTSANTPAFPSSPTVSQLRNGTGWSLQSFLRWQGATGHMTHIGLETKTPSRSRRMYQRWITFCIKLYRFHHPWTLQGPRVML